MDNQSIKDQRLENQSLEEKFLDGPKVDVVGPEDKRERQNKLEDSKLYNKELSEEELRTIEAYSSEQNRYYHQGIIEQSMSLHSPFIPQRKGYSFASRTGPKGVLEDYRRISNTDKDEIDLEIEGLMHDDDILEEFKLKMQGRSYRPKFGSVKFISNGWTLLQEIDDEVKEVLVIVHIFRKFSHTCSRMNRHLETFAAKHGYIKILAIEAQIAGLSHKFATHGVPALLAYQGGELMNSLIGLEEKLDQDFTLEDVIKLLKENKIYSS